MKKSFRVHPRAHRLAGYTLAFLSVGFISLVALSAPAEAVPNIGDIFRNLGNMGTNIVYGIHIGGYIMGVGCGIGSIVELIKANNQRGDGSHKRSGILALAAILLLGLGFFLNVGSQTVANQNATGLQAVGMQ